MKILLVGLLALSGCITSAALASNQASFDHGCPTENIKVVSFSNDNRSAVLNVCGEVRRYKDMNGSIYDGMSVWVDVTKLAEK
jgi:hypothetical protein